MTDLNLIELYEQAKKLPFNPKADDLKFEGKVVVVTGAGGGLGKAYSLMFARLGAAVVVNDLGRLSSTVKAADAVVNEIVAAGGKAVANYDSVEDGEKVIDTAIKAFGRIDILINNAGILRDKSFIKMSDQDWDLVQNVHLRGTYKVTKAAWPYFLKQKYGRIVNTASGVGLYGNFGQANYSAAKLGILGLSNTLALEGAKYNILVNTIVPTAGTSMTATIWPQELVDTFKPDFVAPLVGFLCHDNCPVTGKVFETGGAWAAQVRWQRAGGVGFPTSKPLRPENIAAKWDKITDFDDGRATHPTTTQEALQQFFENFANTKTSDEDVSASGDGKISAEVAKSKKFTPLELTYTQRDAIIYALGLGATRKDLQWVYENHENFSVLPTYGVVPGLGALMSIDMTDVLGDFNPMMLLHGEQYLEIKNPIPISGKLISTPRIVDILDKGKSVVVVVGVTSKDEKGVEIFENEVTLLIRGIGNFGGKKSGEDRGAATAANVPPKRAPDACIQEKTFPDQAALYRQSGDLNPLHIDPNMSALGGFDIPILHGLCTFGISAKHILTAFGKGDSNNIKSVKARFSAPVFPGETLETQCWKEGNKVIFKARVVERDVIAISGGAVELREDSSSADGDSKQAAGSNAGVAVPGFKSSAIFEDLKASIDSASPAQKQAQAKKVKGIFQVEIKGDGGKSATWFIDLKENPGVGVGSSPKKPDASITISDSDFTDLASGKANAQKLFMAGKLKVRGNMMLATKLGDVVGTKSKL